MKIFNWAYDIFKSLDFNDAISSYLNLAINFIKSARGYYKINVVFVKVQRNSTYRERKLRLSIFS